jgi:hypothetical protein
MKPADSFYEIELRAVLSEEQYLRLSNELSQNQKLINEETVHTTKYSKEGRQEDIRLKHSDKTTEIIIKRGDTTEISRKETRIPFMSMEQLDYFSKGLIESGFKADPPWIEHKKEFEYSFNGFIYVISLQDVKNFAYIIEIEFLSKNNEVHIHEPNIKSIMKKLGCEPVNPDEFMSKINEYRNKFSN